jgi:hypothetical protein
MIPIAGVFIRFPVSFILAGIPFLFLAFPLLSILA